MSGFAAKVMIVAVVILLIVTVISRFVRRVTPAPATARRQRMPILIAFGGAVLIAAGFTLGVAAFTSRYTADLWPARVASVVLLLAGLAIVVAYRNWYLQVGTDAVRFRTLLGQERRIAYRDVTSYRMVQVAGHPHMVLEADGVKLRVDARRYDLRLLTAALGG